MASSLLRRSVVQLRPAVAVAVSAYRQLGIHIKHQHSENVIQTRLYSSPPKLTFDLAFLSSQMEIMSEVPSMLLTLVNDEEITVDIPGMEKTETDKGPCVTFQMPGLRVPKGESKVVRNDAVIDQDGNFLIIFKTSKETYLAGIKLPAAVEKIDPDDRIDVLISKGTVKFTLPFLKNTNFVDSVFKIPHPTPYCVAFHRSDLGKKLCEIIACAGVKSKSFTMYKKDSGESMYIKGNMPGMEKIVVGKEGMCVSLNMPGFEIEDVESGFEYDTLIIEGKRDNEHYIAGIRMPEGFNREDNMIKREMQDGLFQVTLPHVNDNVNRPAFSVYR